MSDQALRQIANKNWRRSCSVQFSERCLRTEACERLRLAVIPIPTTVPPKQHHHLRSLLNESIAPSDSRRLN